MLTIPCGGSKPKMSSILPPHTFSSKQMKATGAFSHSVQLSCSRSLFLAARREGVAPLPYTRSLIRSGLAAVAERLNQVDPALATQFLDVSFSDANLADRFLLSAWGTLTARMRPLLTETVVRCLPARISRQRCLCVVKSQ